MQTTIGQRLTTSPHRPAVASAFALGVVAADFTLVLWNRYLEGTGVLAVLSLAVYLRLAQGDTASLGLEWPAQGWRYWVRVTLLLGAAVGACVVAGLGIWVLSGRELPVYATRPSDLGEAFLRMCVFAPVLEEAIYRLVLCVPLTAWLGPWRAIAASGLVFGALHLAYGNPSPENLVGGFFLAWAYLKSESIVVPVVLHALGNLCALAGQVSVWYWLYGGA